LNSNRSTGAFCPRLSGVVQNPLKLPPFALAHAGGLLRHRLTLQHPAHAIKGGGGQVRSPHTVILERLIGIGHPVGGDFTDGVGVDPDLVLGVGVGAQAQEVQEVVQIDLPVPLRRDIRRPGPDC
jgi:hypothetical protein